MQTRRVRSYYRVGQGSGSKMFAREDQLLTAQNHASQLNNLLVDHWYSGQGKEDADFLYIDGHVRIYYG